MKGYKLLLVSAVGDRDGMALELAEKSGEQVAEVFVDESTGYRTVRFYTDSAVPLDAVEWLLAEASRQL